MRRFSDVLVLDKPVVGRAKALERLVPVLDCDVQDEKELSKYRKTADEVGVSVSGLVIEEFRLWLAKKDMPVFNLAEVVPYMDEVAARDNETGYGWHWCPVRPRDVLDGVAFGRASRFEPAAMWNELGQSQMNSSLSRFEQLAIAGGLRHPLKAAPAPRPAPPAAMRSGVTPASDYYFAGNAVYARTIPLHALEKIALVEREFGVGKVKFLVTDYKVLPHVVINPDPFLMAVVPNAELVRGKGRFVIDVWDEPGFGIARMVK